MQIISLLYSMDAEKIERLRSKAVFRAVEKLIEDEGDGSRLVSQEGVWRASRCMSGEEFEMSLEERSLGRKKAYVCCSVFCYEAVEEVAERLGSRKDAAERFMALYESAKYQREKKKKDEERERVEENKRPSSSSGTGRSLAAAGEQLAAGTRKSPVMKASIEGYRPKNAKKDGQQQERRVRFSDEEGGAEQSNGMTGNAARFVFDIEDPKGHVEGDVTSLGDQFGTLRVVESNDTHTIMRRLISHQLQLHR
eukprot:jgi/Picre1/32713/NNA_008058.t1